MKKMTKVMLTIAAVLATIGLALMIAASMMGGGISQVYTMAKNGEHNFGDWHFEDGIYFSPKIGLTKLDGGNESCENTYGEEIKHLKIETDCADIQIRVEKREKLTVEMEKGYLRYYEEEVENSDTLEISYDTDSHNYKEGPDISIYIPESWEMKTIIVENEMGDIVLADLSKGCEKVDFYTAMGDIITNRCRIDGTYDAHTAMGNVTVEDGYFRSASLDSNMGNVEFYGVTEGDLTLTTSLGDAIAEIEGNEKDYNVDISTNMGSAFYNSKKHHNDMEGSYCHDSEHAKADICLNSSMGDVRLTIEE